MIHGQVPWLSIASIEPSYLIAALFLLGLTIVFILHSRHYKRMEKLASEMYGIRDLKEEITAIRQGLKTVDIEGITGLLEDIREALHRLEQKMESPSAREEPPKSGEEEVDLYALIEKRLTGRGFQNISFLSDPSEVAEGPEGETRLAVEAYREGVAYKGYVGVKEGSIVSERINPAYTAFP